MIRVKSVQRFVQVVCEVRDRWIVDQEYFDPWFRGQTKESWALSPSIFRYEDLLKEEDEIRSEFQRKGSQYMTERPPDDFWGWYFLMQHSGAPTRLLDWTDSALAALFFALNSGPAPAIDSEDAAVWMLDPWWLNKVVLQNGSILMPDFDEAKPYLYPPYEHTHEGNTWIKPGLPVAIDPPFIARRVAAQRSHFHHLRPRFKWAGQAGRQSRCAFVENPPGKRKGAQNACRPADVGSKRHKSLPRRC